MNFDEFLNKQKEIYDRFNDKNAVINGGIVPNLKPQQSGYLVILRHPESVADKVEALSEKANKIIPGVIYHKDHVHTTITDYKLTEGDFIPDRLILDGLSAAVHEIKKDIVMPKIFYPNWTTNPNTIMAAGHPVNPADSTFFDIAQKYLAATEKYGITSDSKDGGVRMPWGAHITTFRYNQKVDPVEGKEQIVELFNMLKSSFAIEMSKTEFIDVGYFTLTGKDMNYTIHERFKI